MVSTGYLKYTNGWKKRQVFNKRKDKPLEKKELVDTPSAIHGREKRKKFAKLKSKYSCVVCGFRGNECPPAIHFNHRDPNKKYMTVSHVFERHGFGQQLYDEIDKCDPLCATCHHIHHYTWGETAGEYKDGQFVPYHTVPEEESPLEKFMV